MIRNEPTKVTLYKSNIEDYPGSCCSRIWRGIGPCDGSCICLRNGEIIPGGLQHLVNYGYVLPFAFEIVDLGYE